MQASVAIGWVRAARRCLDSARLSPSTPQFLQSY